MRWAESEEHGCVVVMLGSRGELVSRVALATPYTDAGLSDVDVLNASIAHLTAVRDELVRIGGDLP